MLVDDPVLEVEDSCPSQPATMTQPSNKITASSALRMIFVPFAKNATKELVREKFIKTLKIRHKTD